MLSVRRCPTSIPIVGVGRKQSYSKGSAHLWVGARNDAKEKHEVMVYILPKLISYKPKCSKVAAYWPHLVGLQLADPYFYSNAPTNLLIGVYFFQYITEGTTIKDPSGVAVATLTLLGWLLLCSSGNNNDVS